MSVSETEVKVINDPEVKTEARDTEARDVVVLFSDVTGVLPESVTDAHKSSGKKVVAITGTFPRSEEQILDVASEIKSHLNPGDYLTIITYCAGAALWLEIEQHLPLKSKPKVIMADPPVADLAEPDKTLPMLKDCLFNLMARLTGNTITMTLPTSIREFVGTINDFFDAVDNWIDTLDASSELKEVATRLLSNYRFQQKHAFGCGDLSALTEAPEIVYSKDFTAFFDTYKGMTTGRNVGHEELMSQPLVKMPTAPSSTALITTAFGRANASPSPSDDHPPASGPAVCATRGPVRIPSNGSASFRPFFALPATHTDRPSAFSKTDSSPSSSHGKRTTST